MTSEEFRARQLTTIEEFLDLVKKYPKPIHILYHAFSTQGSPEDIYLGGRIIFSCGNLHQLVARKDVRYCQPLDPKYGEGIDSGEKVISALEKQAEPVLVALKEMKKMWKTLKMNEADKKE
jgi:phenylacetate-coenzyme A ligase PaaK-like adenylate-forming protein